MPIYIYKTSVVKRSDIKQLSPLLDQLGEWNFDLEDCDKILRIESDFNVADRAIDLLNQNGFLCIEL